MTDELLIKRAKKGDMSAFEELAVKYRDRIYAVCLRVTKNREDALDASQESLVKIYLNLEKFAMKSEFSTWVYSISKNTALDIVRKRGKELSAEDAEFLLSDFATEDQPQIYSQREELKKELKAQIDKLPADQRSVVVLIDVEEYSYVEAADILKISVGTLKSRLHRGREKLRMGMLPYLEGYDEA